MTRLVNFRMNVNTHKAMRLIAAERGMTLTDLLNELSEEHVNKHLKDVQEYIESCE